MSNAKRCICRGRPLHELIGAFTQRSQASVAASMREGKGASFERVALTARLVRELAEGGAMAFQSRYDSYDHHLPSCPCSPRFASASG